MTGTERKVFQKYYPPDFDPTKLPRAKKPKNLQWVQRVMTPFNMRCNTCNEYIYKGKKFNMRREPADEFYLGIRIWRFYFRCPNCLADISFKTDLENCDYQAEHGATRLFEAFKLWKDSEKAKEAKEEEDKNDPMKQLEKRTKASRAEMEAMGKLEEMQEVNRRHEGAALTVDSYLHHTDPNASIADRLKRQEEADEELVKQIFQRTNDGKFEKRLTKEEEDEGEVPLFGIKFGAREIKPKVNVADVQKKRGNDQKSLLSQTVILKKTKKEVKAEPVDEAELNALQERLLSGIVVPKREGEESSSASEGEEDEKGKGRQPASSSATRIAPAASSLVAYSSSDSD